MLCLGSTSVHVLGNLGAPNNAVPLLLPVNCTAAVITGKHSALQSGIKCHSQQEILRLPPKINKQGKESWTYLSLCKGQKGTPQQSAWLQGQRVSWGAPAYSSQLSQLQVGLSRPSMAVKPDGTNENNHHRLRVLGYVRTVPCNWSVLEETTLNFTRVTK